MRFHPPWHQQQEASAFFRSRSRRPGERLRAAKRQPTFFQNSLIRRQGRFSSLPAHIETMRDQRAQPGQKSVVVSALSRLLHSPKAARIAPSDKEQRRLPLLSLLIFAHIEATREIGAGGRYGLEDVCRGFDGRYDRYHRPDGASCRTAEVAQACICSRENFTPAQIQF